MSAREAMLAGVRAAHAAAQLAPHPHPGRYVAPPVTDPIGRFIAVAEAGGSHVTRTTRDALTALAASLSPAGGRVLSALPNVPGAPEPLAHPHTLADLAVYVVEGTIGVAESGAVWLPLDDSAVRAALYLAQQVLIVLRADRIVGTMHDAYRAIDLTASAFGCFVAGPSKTADIEQSLVVGAHGPLGLTIALVD